MTIHFVCGNSIHVKEKTIEECEPLGSSAFYVTRTDGSKNLVVTASICFIVF